MACGASAPAAPSATPPLPKLGTINGDAWLAMPFDQRTALMTQALHDFIRCPSSVTANDLAVVVTQQATIKKAATDVATVLITYAMSNGCVPAS
jgi:hypothetical protein